MTEPGWKGREGKGHRAKSVKEIFPRASSLRNPCHFGHLPMAKGLRADKFQDTDHMGQRNRPRSLLL